MRTYKFRLKFHIKLIVKLQGTQTYKTFILQKRERHLKDLKNCLK